LAAAVGLKRVEANQTRHDLSNAPIPRGRCAVQPAARLNVRLRAEDRLLLHERAAVRGMAASTYVSVLVRSHLRALTPLPKEELLALKRSVGELGAVGRNLNQVAKTANAARPISGIGREEFRAILRICEALRDHTKKLIKENTASWAVGHGNPQD
jgi:hypothetical protein